MSIPPLVCSTPPPPDQCEEDKDPDDFGIPYNLSQDDDDDSFGYGDFSSYNHYPSNHIDQEKETSKNKKDISLLESKQVDSCDSNQTDGEELQDVGTMAEESKPKIEEDVNVEDLGLEINEISISSSEKDDEQSDAENFNVDNTENVLDIRNDAPETTETPPNLCSKESLVDETKTDQYKETLCERPIEYPCLDLDIQSSEPNSSSNGEVCNVDLSVEETVCKDDFCIEEIMCKNEMSIGENDNQPALETSLDDDFGDFDDFQFASTESRDVAVENYENPWDTNKADDNDEFSNFTANFEPIDQQDSPPNDYKSDEQHASKSVGEDDDFGDFDDFQSSSIDNGKLSLEPGSDQNLPVINFHGSDNEHHIMESITKVLTSVFEVELSEPEYEYEGRLETMLSETWRHLRETDVRQPYILNWNNSLGQKTLLRALCIDSRNILFGPKWGYNMPKYAVNLSAAPLQPQKPLTSSNVTQSETATEKAAPKPGQGGWTDPFTADGQESCNTERESVVEVTATDLDVFEAAITPKPDKIYSSTLNVQPLRQISLPDTHIFTPTDSETPTSKTVHYDSRPPILLPQNLIESKQVVSTSKQHTNEVPNDKNDDEYWEFQDYKSGSDKTPTTTLSSSQQDPIPEIKPTLNSNVTYRTQVLQPIRMEPLIPTVNWPDPGEIKETFDDFSDFVSNSAWSDKREQCSITTTDNRPAVTTGVLDKINDKHKNVEENDKPTKTSNDDFDDDFDTFQSALPTKHIPSDFSFDSLSTLKRIPTHNSTQIADFENAFPKINNVKSETISVSNSIRPNEAILNQNITMSTSNKIPPPSSNLIPNLLQPTPSSSSSTTSQTKQKTGQILQPLSLESYSQINWPNPGIDLQDLSRFNPVETLQSLKSDLSVGGLSKGSSPVHSQKNAGSNQVPDDDIWGEFVSSKPKHQQSMSKKPASFPDDDEWTDFVSSPSVKPQNGLNTISLNVHTNSNIQKSSNSKFSKNNQLPLDIPTLNYITPKASGHSSYNDRHFQNL